MANFLELLRPAKSLQKSALFCKKTVNTLGLPSGKSELGATKKAVEKNQSLLCEKEKRAKALVQTKKS